MSNSSEKKKRYNIPLWCKPNLSIEEAARRYSPQIASRLEGEYHVLHFFGDDIRLLKKNRL